MLSLLFLIANNAAPIMKEGDLKMNKNNNLKNELVEMIYNFMNKSSEHGNVVMDLLGVKNHNKIIQLVNKKGK